MCKEKVAERSCTVDEGWRESISESKIVHNGSAFLGLPVLAAFRTISLSVPDSFTASNSRILSWTCTALNMHKVRAGKFPQPVDPPARRSGKRTGAAKV